MYGDTRDDAKKFKILMDKYIVRAVMPQLFSMRVSFSS